MNDESGSDTRNPSGARLGNSSPAKQVHEESAPADSGGPRHSPPEKGPTGPADAAELVAEAGKAIDLNPDWSKGTPSQRRSDLGPEKK